MDKDQMKSITVTLPESMIAYLDKKALGEPEENRSKLIRTAVRLMQKKDK